jgi:hypothetical protein
MWGRSEIVRGHETPISFLGRHTCCAPQCTATHVSSTHLDTLLNAMGVYMYMGFRPSLDPDLAVPVSVDHSLPSSLWTV